MNVVNRSPGSGSIRFLTGPLAGSTFQISKPVIMIGREPTNDIVISDPSVSRQHARLVHDGGQWSIEKLSMQNIVTVNQRDVQQSHVSDRDTIGLGTGTTFLFLTTPSQSPVDQRPAAPPHAQAAPQQPFPVAPPPPAPPLGGQPPFARQSSTEPVAPPISPGPGTERAPTDQFASGGTVSSHSPLGVPSLEISSNIHANKESIPLTRQVINIGRDPSNDIVINELVVSAFHAQVVREGNQLVFVHPHPARGKTLNGLLYQGRHIRGDEQFRKALARGDIFRIGDEHGTLVTLTYNDGSGAAQDITPEIRPIPLGAPVITIGRLPDNMVVLSHPQVSGRHARLEQVQGGYRIVDLNSTNHVYVNAQRVREQLLKPGDEIRIGAYKLIYTGTQLTQHDESGGIRIDALHLQKAGNKNIILINDISVAIPPRKFVALVGGSGAGKSTLMDALNGLRPAQKGLVLYNGQDYYRHLAAFSTQLGYVPQDDIIHRDLSVERALYYTAKMRLPEDFTEAQIKQRIDEVLEDVEMKHRRNLLVSKLSGGQRKRVSIALELLANPSVFFLDEPTSGLDPGLDRKMMYLLRRLADKGHTIALVTHATNNINVCDYICFLAQGGRLAYFGPPDEAKAYFGKTDFAEIYSALEPTEENPNIPVEAENRFKASQDFQKYVVGPLNQGPAGRTNTLQQTVAVKPPKRGNPWKQFSLLSARYLELLKNDVGNLLILLLQAPVIALLLLLMLSAGGHGTFDPSSVATCPPNPQIPQTVQNKFDCQNVVNFLEDTPQGQSYAAAHGGVTQSVQLAIAQGSGNGAQKFLFIMAFAAVMFGSINGAREIVKEAPIYRRERTVNLGIAPYMFSKIAVLGVLCLLQSAILVLAVNFIAPFQHSTFLPPVLEIYITMALTALAGLMVGLTVSAIAPNNDRAVSFIPIILIPQVVFSGLVFKLDGPVFQFLGAFFADRWAMAAAGSSVGIHGDKLGADDFSFQGTLFSTYSQTEATLHLLLCWGALLLMIVLLGLATAYFLKRKDVRM
jgi:ABC-type multidrug transport system ATPase subunit/pSer/pThr/pTyr-binding forkhead associated (FHA) protein